MKTETQSLSELTWLKIGGPAQVSTPQNKSELIEAIRECESNNKPYRILGNGSNILVADEGISEVVIRMVDCCQEMKTREDIVQVGASVMLPQFINFLMENGYGGIEYLYSVPGTVGGAIFMNAGKGDGPTISDYLQSVEVYKDGDTQDMNISELSFGTRSSIFQKKDDWVILSAKFQFPRQEPDITRKKIQGRMKKVQDRERSKPTAGSVFKSGLKIPTRGLRIGDARFVHNNRICNDGEATFRDVQKLIDVVKLIHKPLFFTEDPELELRIWK